MEWEYFIGENCPSLICILLILKCLAYSSICKQKNDGVFVQCEYEYSNNLSYPRIIDCCLHYPNMCIWTWWTNLFHCLQISITDTLFLWSEPIQIQIPYTFSTDQTSSMNKKKLFMKYLRKTGFEYRWKLSGLPSIIFLAHNLLRIMKTTQDITLHQTCIQNFQKIHIALQKCGTHIDLANQGMRTH